MLDCARGTALLLMLVSHSLELFPGNLDAGDWARINAILLLTKAATPLFVFVFGTTMAFVYSNQMLTPEGFAKIKRRMWRRALFAFLSFEFLVIVIETADKTPLASIWERMMYLRPGNWAEVLNFYIVVLLIGPWLMRWWRGTSKAIRILVVPVLYIAGSLFARLPVPSYLFVVKNIIAGYPPSGSPDIPLDTFPLLQLSSFYLVGLSLGEYLHAGQHINRWRQAFRLAGACILLGLLLSYFASGDSMIVYMKNLALDHYRFPPQISYVLFGLASVLAVTLCCLWLVQVKNWTGLPVRVIELLGRHSLFTFNLQYILVFTVYQLMLGQLHRQTLLLSLVHTLIVTGACVAMVWLWERWWKMQARVVPRVLS